MTQTTSAKTDGIAYKSESVTHYDTREMPWEPFDGYPGAYIKVLTRFDDGQPATFLVYTPPGIMAPESPRRHYHDCREFNFVLGGELPVWEYDGPDQIKGTLVVLKPGYFMERRPGPGGLHGMEPGVGSPTGCISLTWREGTGNWRYEPDYEQGSTDVPFPAESTFVPRAQAGGAVVYENDAVRHIDTRALDWQPHFGGFAGVLYKPLVAFDSGEPFAFINWTPPGILNPEPPGRRHYHNGGEWSLQLEGAFPIWEYESVEQEKGTLVWRKPGAFMDRRAGSLHGVEPGAGISPVGSMTLSWRELPGNWRGEVGYEKGSVHVPFPSETPSKST